MGNDEAKRKEELSAALGFLRRRELKVLSVEEKRDKPDVRVQVRMKSGDRRLGIELRQYDSAEEQGCAREQLSRKTVVHWSCLQNAIEERTACHHELGRIHGRILFHGNSAPSSRQSAAFADECVAIALEVVTAPAWAPNDGQTLKAFPPNYPLLQKYVRCLQLLQGPPIRHLWQVGTLAGSFGGPSWDWVLRKVAEKSEQLRGYDTCGLDEIWLLMYCLPPAGRGRHPATTLMSPCREDLEAPPEEVVAAARGSGFHRVFLYNGCSGWDVELSAEPV